MINLKHYSLKRIMLYLSCFTLIVLALAYSLSTYFLLSVSLSNYMTDAWQRQADNIAEQARFSILTESKSDLEKIIPLLNNEAIKHINIDTGNGRLYASGEDLACDQLSKHAYWCFTSEIKETTTNAIIGTVELIVSKDELNDLLNKSLLRNSLIVFLLTTTIFGFFYYLARQLTRPLDELSTVMARVTDNERGLRIESEGTIEIRHIQDSFNVMIAKIEAYEDTLESQVKLRTLELSDAYKKAQEASQVKSDILKIVSHEMKTPLHSAMYYLHLMRSDDGYFVDEIMGCLDLLKHQIDNLLDYAKAAENKVTLVNNPFFLKGTLDAINNEFKPLIQACDNSFNFTCHYQKSLYSDEQLIRQILNNFISNANKHTQKGLITITCEQLKNHVLISVSDTGCGIDKENLEKIFNPFWQADMSNARNYEGTGLGLAICQLFSETIGATISVVSEVNKGSTFTLSIPLIDEPIFA